MAPVVEGLGDLIVRDALPVSARFGECLDITEFITPRSLPVRTLAEDLGQGAVSDDEFILRCWKWMAKNVSYPPSDRRVFYGPGVKAVSEDFWAMPYETTRDLSEDCDGRTMLMVSLLRHRLAPSMVLGAIGNLHHNNKVGGHAWAVVNRGGEWYIVETTLPSVAESPWVRVKDTQGDYQPAFYFNDRFVLQDKHTEICLPLEHCNLEWLQQYWCKACHVGG